MHETYSLTRFCKYEIYSLTRVYWKLYESEYKYI